VDRTEHIDLAEDEPARLEAMIAMLNLANTKLFAPDRGKGVPAACTAAEHTWGGFYGPFA
jgi:hypothetical protein